MKYDENIRETILKKLLRPDGPNVPRVSEETGIHQGTLYRWVRESKNGVMKKKERSPRQWGIEEKYEAIQEARGKASEELGVWLRAKGLRSEHLELWEREIAQTLRNTRDRSERREMEKENRALKKELNRKEKALAEMSALLVLKKKARLLLGDEEIS